MSSGWAPMARTFTQGSSVQASPRRGRHAGRAREPLGAGGGERRQPLPGAGVQTRELVTLRSPIRRLAVRGLDRAYMALRPGLVDVEAHLGDGDAQVRANRDGEPARPVGRLD